MARKEAAQGPKAFFSVGDLQKRWGVSRSTVKREAEAGRLVTTRISERIVRFSAETVAAFEARATRVSAPRVTGQ